MSPEEEVALRAAVAEALREAVTAYGEQLADSALKAIEAAEGWTLSYTPTDS